MSKKNRNPSAQMTAMQINSTLDVLIEKYLAVYRNYVSYVNVTQLRCQITWKDHSPGRANGGKAFTRLDQYLHILETNSYHCLLFDGSLIRVNFEFENDVLLAQNLLWWPAPYDYCGFLQEGYSPVELISDFYRDSKWYEFIKMRSPIRIDFDCSNNTVDHPHSHLHIEHEDTRLNTNNPICFNRFIDFIFRNFYSQIKMGFTDFDFINYKIPDLQSFDYVSSKLVV